ELLWCGFARRSSDRPPRPIRGIVRLAVGVGRMSVLRSRPPTEEPSFGPSRLRTLPRPPPQVTPTAAALADAIEGELERLGVAQYHVAGYSLGARVALELATRGQTHSVIAIAPD